jgi:spermidine synthase
MTMPWTELDHAVLDNGDVLTLRRDGPDFEIRVGLYELMSSKNPASERAMADMAVARARKVHRVLIGGLGMGYTARAMLDVCGPEALVTVAELVPAVVAWNRGPLADLAGRPLEDPRLSVHIGDVAEALRAGTFDVILLDVDNGPEAVLFEGNGALYTPCGLAAALAGLAPGGVLAVWAADPSPAFERVAGPAVERADIAVGSVTHTLYFLRATPAKMPEGMSASSACKPARRPI